MPVMFLRIMIMKPGPEVPEEKNKSYRDAAGPENKLIEGSFFPPSSSTAETTLVLGGEGLCVIGNHFDTRPRKRNCAMRHKRPSLSLSFSWISWATGRSRARKFRGSVHFK